MTRAHHPFSTYRLQIREAFDLDKAAAVTKYLNDLGADWVYLSPVLEAEPGSDHGYDVVDHSRVDPARGGSVGLQKLSDSAHGLGLGVVIDIVPNHMGVATPASNSWWWDLLKHGQESRYATAFDVDWAAGDNKIRIPVLGDAGDDRFDALEVVGDELHFYDNRYPIAPGTAAAGDSAVDVHSRQNYELVYWKRADSELNYRRFFAVNTLAGIRVEEGWVFDESHAEIGRWFREGLADGLRVDHPDGLADPAGYLDRLAELTGGKHVLVEKILEGDEEMPSDWATAGTTGYDALGEYERVLVDPDGRDALGALDSALRSEPAGEFSWEEMILGTKRGIADGILGSEIRRLARLLGESGAPTDPRVVDALAELAAAFPVYRSYLPQGGEQLARAASAAGAARPDLTDVIATVVQRLGDPTDPAAVRFQQTSGMVMAKGVEDTAFYRYSRLVSLNEVGGEPNVFSFTADEFHARQQRRLATFPHAMTTLSTHDTKRSADVRARITVLAEVADEWAAALERLRQLAPVGDGPFENLLWQSIVGVWPASRERLHDYAEKASREADLSTHWTAPDEEFEKRMHALVDACFDDDRVASELERIVEVIRSAGWSNSLALAALQLTGPGAPDVYQGGELWDYSLVDPDNRREVDFDERRRILAAISAGETPPVDETGAAKLLLTHRALTLRRDRPELFERYVPLPVFGEAASNAVAIDRGGAVVVATRLPVGLRESGGWRGTELHLPAGDRIDALTGRGFTGSRIALSDLLATYPVALLIPAPQKG
ncbi:MULTISPECIES: malto-oligosyltrehalose synthase [unclassified Frondihabitans]|uniref:malto-oligosyltrehalose synthase n=1 Tax=unclassified Frondihabitans TaxID=2626248 RepID=UPI000F4D2D5F|nr:MULTISPECIES: malto-oligosyltrehalose synthase [unclassified Frondihabitans]RPE76425.1 maltooligosyl trehalose synthase [Frondihabitans sp. PhB153]RPF05299.1 maltooligosyl trehalose synthase [Frondihabitans sp. PhB161]